MGLYLYHDFAAEKIQKCLRKHWELLQKNHWKERQILLKHRFLKTIWFHWKNFFLKNQLYQQFHVLYKFKKWFFFSQCQKKKNFFFQICFWKFYIWKKFLQKKIFAKGKAKFLKKIYQTFLKLHFLKHWQKKWFKQKKNIQTINLLQQKTKKKWKKNIFYEWRNVFMSKIILKRLWKKKGGHMLHVLHQNYYLRNCFFVWKYISMLKQQIKKRKRIAFHGFVIYHWSIIH
jgi:hypothetical protein